jgi:crotonobetainyl-CoA:carnitine CoA-transferase CaiB-like acyl-CoA transferase
MAGFGLSFDVVHDINPRLVMTSISNFGQTGPYKDYQAEEIVEYAMSGLMQLTGRPDRPPLCSGPAMTQYTAGIQAYIATLLAIWRRAATGVGQYVDVSIQESALDNIEVVLTEYLHAGKIANRTGDEHPLVPWKLYPCKDGYAAIIGGPIRHWLSAAGLFEEPRLLETRLQHIGGRMKNREEVGQCLEPWLARHGKREIYEAGQRRQLAFGYLADAQDVMQSLQHDARGFFVDIDHPVTGSQRYCGAPFRSSATAWRSERAPLLGEHTEVLLTGGLGYTHEDLVCLRAQEII